VPGRLLIVCGAPGSGKTTIARAIAGLDPKAVHIQTDDFRGMVTEPDFSPEESEFVYQAAVAAAACALDAGRLTILDGTFNSRRRRERTMEALSGKCTAVDVVVVTCDLRTALARNASRGGRARVPEDRLADIYSKFEAPEGGVTVDTTSGPPQAAAEEVFRALSYPLVPPE
jgi:predicted kinase